MVVAIADLCVVFVLLVVAILVVEVLPIVAIAGVVVERLLLSLVLRCWCSDSTHAGNDFICPVWL